MEIKTVDKVGINFLINEEGLRLYSYRDSVGIPTIGIGSTYYETGKRVTMNDKPITKARAIQLFKNILQNYERAVWSVTRDDITQNQFNAMVSLSYNIGISAFKNSSVLIRVNVNPNNPTIEQAFLMWRYAGKKPILLGRRQREANLYFTP